MQVDKKVAAAAAAVVLAVTVGVIMRTVHPEMHDNSRGFIVRFPDGGPGSGFKCVNRSAWASSEALALYGMAPDAGHWVRARVCAKATDGGPDEIPLPTGMMAVEDASDVQEDWTPGKHEFETWQSGSAGDPSPCACSTGSNCEKLSHPVGGSAQWIQAPKNETLREWRGAGCLPKTCVELLGFESSMPGDCQP